MPLATWYRFRLQAEKSRTLFLLMTRVACANSCAAVSLHCHQGTVDWRQAALHGPRLLAGLRYRVSVERGRCDSTRKKPAASAKAYWSSTIHGRDETCHRRCISVCIYRDFAAQALTRRHPELHSRAVAVLSGDPPLERVFAMNQRARLLGLESV